MKYELNKETLKNAICSGARVPPQGGSYHKKINKLLTANAICSGFGRWLKILIFIFLLPLANVVSAASIKDDLTPEQINELNENLSEIQENLSLENCATNLVSLYDFTLAEFLKYLESGFQNKSSNTSLINAAIVRYTNYKKTINNYFLSLAPERGGQGAGNIDAEFSAYSKCSELTDEYLLFAKERMISHLKATNSTKKTTALVEKYQAINNQLRDLNLMMAQFFSNFVTFKNKLPAFVSQCFTK